MNGVSKSSGLRRSCFVPGASGDREYLNVNSVILSA